MIILDTNVVRGMAFNSTEARLVRVIRESKADRVALPWMAFEERLAQYVIAYNEAHSKAMSAHKDAARKLPDPTSAPAPALTDPAEVRDLWEARLRELVEVIPMTGGIFQEALEREAYQLAPAGRKSNIKTGARDVAIWLSAVEYAHTHPDETVYFVSGNTNDFTDGKGDYPAPMDADRGRAGDNFVHLTALSEVLERLATPMVVNEKDVEQRLQNYSRHVETTALVMWSAGEVADVTYHLSRAVTAQWQAGNKAEPVSFVLSRKRPLKSKLLKVDDVKAYKLGEDTWCTAQATWQFVGLAYLGDEEGYACCTWTAHVMMPLAEDGSAPQIFDSRLPEAPASSDGIDWPVRSYSVEEWATHTRNVRMQQSLLDGPLEDTMAWLYNRMTRHTNRAAIAAVRSQDRLDKIQLDVDLDAMAGDMKAAGFDDMDPDEREAAIDAERDKVYEQYDYFASDSDVANSEG
ncbi:PIN domain-containing protein [Streptomyces anulatus]|uniref:PIN domain-containing protein n=1 Tax=Streptomyces anulatus TaxID=1892 RepID=UPI0022548642|nr:PIN domain-containing protein [Streptomyces anulatus]MCX4489880.1 PIN domain-containing protein [Streptomyces anulatus]